MNFLKKLTGLFVFVAAVAGAVLLSRHFSAPPPPPPPEAPSVPVLPREPQLAPAPHANVTFKARQVTLDFASKKSHLTLELERDPAGTAPESVWAWVAFFPPDGARGGRCSAGPAEVRRPFARGGRATVVVEADASGCEAPRTPSATLYARVHVSAVSAAAAREEGASVSAEDPARATPVVISNAGR